VLLCWLLRPPRFVSRMSSIISGRSQHQLNLHKTNHGLFDNWCAVRVVCIGGMVLKDRREWLVDGNAVLLYFFLQICSLCCSDISLCDMSPCLFSRDK
jgi:hypothetical protein